MTPADILASPETILTLHSDRTGREFIYRILRAPLKYTNWHYVDNLDGLSNEDDFHQIGTILDNKFTDYPATPDLPTRAFAFFWRRLREARPHPELRVTLHKHQPA